jgi:hypothetical protein
MVMQTMRVSYGTPPAASAPAHDGREAARFEWRAQVTTLVALAPLAVVMVLFGVHVPAQVERLLDDVAVVLGPVAR